MKRGLIRNFRSKRNIELMKYQIGNTIQMLTKDNLSLIRENVTVRKNGNVAVFTFGIYLNGAITEEQEALEDQPRPHTMPYPFAAAAWVV